MISLSPDLIPDALDVLPSITALAPRMSSTKDAAGDCIFRIQRPQDGVREVDAVTGVPFEKRKPFLIRT